MAPLPANNTPVLFIDYTCGTQRHTAEVRLPSGSGTAEAGTAYGAMKTVMLPFIHTSDSVVGGRFRPAGSNVSQVLSVTASAGTFSGTLDPDKKPNFASWVGRDTQGRRVRFTLFTAAVSLEASGYRNNAPSTAEAAVRTALIGASVNARTISGDNPIWNSYVNYGANSYFQRKLRRV